MGSRISLGSFTFRVSGVDWGYDINNVTLIQNSTGEIPVGVSNVFLAIFVSDLWLVH